MRPLKEWPAVGRHPVARQTLNASTFNVIISSESLGAPVLNKVVLEAR